MKIGEISSDDLKLCLSFFPMLESERQKSQDILYANDEVFFAVGHLRPTWSFLYELPVKEHMLRVLNGIGAESVIKELALSSNQIQAIPVVAEKLLTEMESDTDYSSLTDEETSSVREGQLVLYSLATSAFFTIKSLMTFGLYINELIAVVREGGKGADSALFRAVKIDPSILSCPSVSLRIHQAVLKEDKIFFNELSLALNGKLTKRESKVYQNMRLVLQVMLEYDAPKLSQEEMYTLFVEELQIASSDRDSDIGDVANNLRQFAYQFMKQKSVSQ